MLWRLNTTRHDLMTRQFSRVGSSAAIQQPHRTHDQPSCPDHKNAVSGGPTPAARVWRSTVFHHSLACARSSSRTCTPGYHRIVRRTGPSCHSRDHMCRAFVTRALTPTAAATSKASPRSTRSTAGHSSHSAAPRRHSARSSLDSRACTSRLASVHTAAHGACPCTKCFTAAAPSGVVVDGCACGSSPSGVVPADTRAMGRVPSPSGSSASPSTRRCAHDSNVLSWPGNTRSPKPRRC